MRETKKVEIEEHILSGKKMIENRLEEIFRSIHSTSRFDDALSYTVLAGGKRLRALFTLESAKLYGIEDGAIDVACAVEIVHAFSLIHDDLPIIDNGTIRRGKPTNHLIFGEDTALLAGDGLAFLAFDLLSTSGLKPSSVVKLSNRLANLSGIKGMILGEMLDIDYEKRRKGKISEEQIQRMYALKTASLFQFAFGAGPTIGEDEKGLRVMDDVGLHFGIAFQIADDIADVIEDISDVGKDVKKDESKMTILKKHTVDESRDIMRRHLERAVSLLYEYYGGDGNTFVYLVNTSLEKVIS